MLQVSLVFHTTVSLIDLNNTMLFGLADRLLLLKCYDRKKVKSLVYLIIIPVVGWGGKPTEKNQGFPK